MIAGMSGCVDRDADVAGRERAKLSADHDDDVVDGLEVVMRMLTLGCCRVGYRRWKQCDLFYKNLECTLASLEPTSDYHSQRRRRQSNRVGDTSPVDTS